MKVKEIKQILNEIPDDFDAELFCWYRAFPIMRPIFNLHVDKSAECVKFETVLETLGEA